MSPKKSSALLLAGAVAAGYYFYPSSKDSQLQAAPQESTATLPGGGQLKVTMMGHQYRQDDLPSIATAPDGTLWSAWLSYVGDRDDIGLRKYQNGAWGPLQWVPNTSGDAWLPQAAVDASNRVWVIWSQMAGNNWDIYARSFDPAKETWGPIERLTTHLHPDINPRVAADGKGRFAVVYQAFRGSNSNIYLRVFDGKWGSEIRVTNRAANDWEPAAAFDSKGAIWVAYDSYKSGNYDVLMAKVEGGQVGPEIPVATSPSFDARATVAVDTADRVWVAWEQGRHLWGKDQGYILRQSPNGSQLGADRTPRLRVYDNGQWREPAKPLGAPFESNNTYQPHVFSDGKGSVWVAVKQRVNGPQLQGGRRGPGYFEYWMTHLDGGDWSKPFALPNSKGRSSTRMSATLDKDKALWAAWDTDSRDGKAYHRPLHQRIHAAKMPAAPASNVSWGTAPSDYESYGKPHDNEAADLKAIRAYRANVGVMPHRIVRGDFHRHTEFSWDGGGAVDGSLLDFYRYMIDAAGMDFGASTDHQGGAWPYWWWLAQKMTDMHHVPGAYTAIFGYERSATFPNGHRNMFFAKRSDSRVTPFFLRAGAEQWNLGENRLGDEPGIGSGDLVENDTKLLYEEIRNRNAVVISHTSGTRMGTDWRDNDEKLEPVVEIFQGARTNYEQLGAPLVAEPDKDGPHVKQAGYQPEGMVKNAWAKGYKLGIITSSDHGSTHISFAMVYTADPSRQAVLDAIRKRHTYGAMDNIILDVRMGQYFMGDEFAMTSALPIKVKVAAPRKVARVVVIKDSQVIYTVTPNTRNVDFEFTDKGDVSGRHYYYVRVEQEDKMLAWSSPFFVNYPKK